MDNLPSKILISVSGADGEVLEGGVYSKVLPDDNSQRLLSKLAKLVHFVEPKIEDSHCTVLYSTNDSKVTKQPNTSITTAFKAKIEKFLIWKGHNEQDYLVCALFSPELSAANAKWMDLGYSSTFPEYRPHISFKSKIEHPDKEKAVIILNNYCRLHFPEGADLKFGPEIVDALRD